MASTARNRTLRIPLGLGLLLAALVLGCPSTPAPRAPEEAAIQPHDARTSAPNECQDGQAATRSLLEENEPRYRDAIRSAAQWLDALEVDPFELRKRGIKGKKKLVELLDVYLRLWQIAPDDEKRRYHEKMTDIVAVTYEARFHDMNEVDNLQFKQDATSYMRAAYLMEQAGLDTSLYRQEIANIHQRLDDHMPSRGSHQRMAFHWYYDHFGLEEPFDLAAGYEGGIIDGRKDPYEFTKRLDVYHLTHEVFIPYRYGEDLDADFFDDDELTYLRRALDRITVYWMMRDDADLVAELVSCMAFLELTRGEVYREAIEYLLNAQREDGSWGRYEGGGRKRYGEFVDQALYLHTTAVAIDALTVAFEWRR